jgi:prephenate dehydrogenase
MNILVVGCGLIGGQRVQALTRNPAVSSITVCDPKIAAGTELSAKAKVVEAEAALSRAYQAAVVAIPHETGQFIAVAGGTQSSGTLASAEDGLHAMQIVDDCYRKLPPPEQQ